MTFANAALDALAGARASLRPTKSVVTKGDGSRTVQQLGDGSEVVVEKLTAVAPDVFTSAVRWVAEPRGTLPRLPAASTLLVLDFDCTLAALHMYTLRRTREGAAARAADSAAFFSKIFGGPERIAKLQAFLRSVRSKGVHVAIVSNGLEEEIGAALASAGIAELVDTVRGSESQASAGTADKPAYIARLCAERGDATRDVTHVCFADDDRSNFPAAAAEAAIGDTWRLEAADARVRGTRLLAWPAGAAEGAEGGLSGTDLTGIVGLFAEPQRESADAAAELRRPPPIPERAFKESDPTTAWQVVGVTQQPTALPLAQFQADGCGPPAAGHVRFVAISDTHGKRLSSVPPGDVLLHCGDFSNTGRPEEVRQFCEWFGSLPHPRKILIAGNHDLALHGESYADTGPRFGHPPDPDGGYAGASAKARALVDAIPGCEYLCDSGTSVRGLRVWGSPWQPEFHDWAFNLPRGEACRAKWRLIPVESDVVLTHGPPLGHGDLCSGGHRAGCLDLLDELQTRVRPAFHVSGHIHEGFGACSDGATTYLNASSCTLRYRADNAPLVFDLPAREE